MLGVEHLGPRFLPVEGHLAPGDVAHFILVGDR
jgi:hypothetical protein